DDRLLVADAVDQRTPKLVSVRTARAEGDDDGQRRLPRPEVAADRLPRHLGAAPDAEKVVDHLEGQAQTASEPGESCDRAWPGTGEHGANRRRATEERAGLGRRHREVLRDGGVQPALEGE